MPSKKQYNLVNDDAYDSRIPLYNEEAFQHGITFHAKYIGSLDVPRPSSRVEIVAAMRRIRYEFKAKSMKKKKISLTVSVDGVKVILRSKRRTNQWPWDENKFTIMHHPIYRIFYVSHDSQDLKIFSYIARDGGTNSFKCNVFKSKKKSQAMRIVRTIGQAFEVCHKLSLALASTSACTGGMDDIGDSSLHDHSAKGKCQGDGASEPNSCDMQEETSISKSIDIASNKPATPDENSSKKTQSECLKSASTSSDAKIPDSSSISVYHHIQLLKEQLEQQNQQMQTVVGQVQLLKDQLSAETTARLEAQAQNHHLLAHNRELLEHIKKLVDHIHEIEEKFHKEKLQDTLQREAFSSSNSFLADANTRLNHGSEKVSFNLQSTPDDHIISEFSISKPLPNTFGRQLSVPITSITQQSPYAASTFNSSHFSLPDCPSQSSFASNLEGIFKTDAFISGSPKETTDEMSKRSLAKPSSPSHLKSKAFQNQNNLFDFDSSSPYSSSSIFSYNNSPKLFDTKKDAENNLGPSQVSPHQDNSHFNFNRDSFIAQVTRDIAKMNIEQDHGDPLLHKSQIDPSFPPLFKN